MLPRKMKKHPEKVRVKLACMQQNMSQQSSSMREQKTQKPCMLFAAKT